MGGWVDLYMSRYIILLLFIGLAWGQDCTADDGTDGIELWDECYSIENTDSLDLSNSGIADSIPSEIGNLINLIYLDLSSNNLKSAIPTSIGNLINLRHLDLSDNRETFMWSTTDGIDSIPSEIGNLINLVHLDLSLCYINYVPSETGNLINLEYLNLRGNLLIDFEYFYDYDSTETFHIDLSIFTNLINLKKIDLSGCGIIGQLGSEFENLTNLEYLKLSGNQFTGIIPSEIWNFENLKALELGGFFIMGASVFVNSITGTIPDEVGNLINLKKLDLNNNEFSGEIPSSLFNLDSLDTLFLGGNSFSGTLSESICNFIEDSNSVYSIGGNKLCPPYPSCIQDDDLGFQYILDCDSACGEGEVQLWTGCYPIDSTFELTIDNLYNLDIDSLEILPQIGDLVNLVYLNLSGQGFTGNIPGELGNLVNLETLDLSNNPEIVGSIPLEIGNLTSLINLDLSMGFVPSWIGEGKIGNLNGEIPSQIGQLTNLELLDISVCQISGPIPSEIGNLVNLKTLKLNGYPVNTVSPGYYPDQSNPGGIGNSLSGSIPPEIGNLANLELLDLSSNNLDGSLPEELWNLASLTNLNLTNNQLSGNLSAGIENLQSLEYIDIDRNYFEGDLPIEIFNLNALKRLSISANQFSGEIPGEISNLSNLVTLHIDNNQFSGEIPAGICYMNIFNGYNIKINSNEFCPPYPSCVANHDPDTDNSWLINYSNPGDQYCEQCESNYAYDGECVEQSEMDFLQSMIDNSSETINMHFDANINGLIEPFEFDCEWDGGRITIARLKRMGLSGEIPVSIGDLESIQDIELYGNQLTGPIPPEIGNLNDLTNLEFQDNQLTGSIPPEIGNLMNIGNNYGSINLSNNQLIGYVPESICNLNIDNIFLTNNNLCPPYPSCLEDDNVGEQDTSNCDLVSILDDGLPIAFNLYNAYPNPFNPVTTLRYDLPEPSNVNIIIYDMLGRQVKTLINQNQDAGHKSIRWNATNDYGKPVSAGVYLYRIQAGQFRQTKKMVLLK